MNHKNLHRNWAAKVALFVLLLCAVGLTKGYAYDFSAVCETGQTLYYNITNAEYHYVELTCPGNNNWNSYDQPVGDIILPRYVYDAEDNQYYLNSIGSYAFYGCTGFTGSITIPSSVTTIGYRSFYNSGLTSITIPNSITTIGSEAFLICRGLEQIVVESENAVYDSRNNCNAIIKTSTNELMFGCKNTIIPNTVTSIGHHAFYCCNGLVGNLTIPNSVISIGVYAFYLCSGLTSLTLGDSVTTIGERAFYVCGGLSGELNIPNSVTSIGNEAFVACGVFEQIVVGPENEVYDSRDNCNAIIRTSTNELILGSNNSFIPNTVTSIGNYAFYECTGLIGELTIPNSVTTIGNSAFSNCSGFTGKLTIPNSVTTIGNSAFSNCSGFTGNLTIPNSVTTIGNYAFSGCSGFVGGLVIPDSVISIGNSAFSGCSFTGDLIIPNSVVSVGEEAFRNCSGFTGLTIGNSVTTIGRSAFSNCTGFTGSLTIPNSVTTIEYSAFYGCSGFTGRLTIPNTITTLGDSAFAYCNGFTSLSINIGTIGGYCFDGCSGLSSIVFGDSVTSIGDWAFWYNPLNLEFITMLAVNPPTLSSLAFFGTPTIIYVPYESLETYKTASNWSNYQSKIYPFMQKSITGYGTSEGGWHFIASPLLSSIVPTEVDNMILETEYDLYRFNQSADAEWENYKDPSTVGFTVNNGRGYLYASKEDVNVIFKGTFNEFDERMVSLAYDPNAEFAGWNLVGNPFPVNAYANRSYYVMNEGGTAIEPVAVSSEVAIDPCTGVMVKAENTGESVTFSKTAPETQGQNNGSLQIAVAQANTRGASTSSTTVLDKAVVSFNEGDELGKFVFNKDNAKLYIPQGNEEYAIACAEKQGEMPLNFEATENGEYTISIKAENAEFGYLHLIDNLTGADIDLLPLCKGGKGNSQPATYTFTAKTTDYASRFRLVFSVSGDADSDNETPFAFVNNGDIVITTGVSDATLQIVDVMGRFVYQGNVMNRVSTDEMTKGVYVIRLIKGNDVKTQKMMIE